ncbi:MAG: hypothetical protein ACOYI8_11240 [Christensenellales bacterium]|jgi:hypothetical protein
MKKVLCLLLLAALGTSLSACGNDNDSPPAEVFSMRFTDAVSYDTIKSLDETVVTIVGYMATLSPINGKYMYLMNMPYQSCPFCVPNTTQLANTMAVYAKEGEKFAFTDQAIRVTGMLQLGDYTDEFGYFYNYRIVNATYEEIDLTTISEKYGLWQSIASDGIVADINTMFDYLYFVCSWPEYTFSFTNDDGVTEDVAMYPGDVVRYLEDDGPNGYAKYRVGDYFPSLIRRIRAISKTELQDLETIVNDAKALEEKALSDLSAGEYTYRENTDTYVLNNADALGQAWYDLYLRFSEWLAKWEI